MAVPGLEQRIIVHHAYLHRVSTGHIFHGFVYRHMGIENVTHYFSRQFRMAMSGRIFITHIPCQAIYIWLVKRNPHFYFAVVAFKNLLCKGYEKPDVLFLLLCTIFSKPKWVNEMMQANNRFDVVHFHFSNHRIVMPKGSFIKAIRT